MNTRTDVINKVIAEHGYRSYLEIGYQTGANFQDVDCEVKRAVDPDKTIVPIPGDDLVPVTSDEYFESNTQVWDVVFIDGLHHAEQVGRDISNAMSGLSENGAIILHDLNPATKEQQEVPCHTAIWNGDCWRAWHGFKNLYPEVRTEFYKFDHGVGVIWPEGRLLWGPFVDMTTTFEEYRAHVDSLL